MIRVGTRVRHAQLSADLLGTVRSVYRHGLVQVAIVVWDGDDLACDVPLSELREAAPHRPPRVFSEPAPPAAIATPIDNGPDPRSFLDTQHPAYRRFVLEVTLEVMGADMAFFRSKAG